MSRNFKTLRTALLTGASVATISMLSAPAFATEVTNNDTFTATDATGLVESNEAGAIGVTVNSNSGAITLGADATNSVDVTQAGGATALTVNVTTSGVANGVIFAGDVDAGGNAGDTIVINATNDNVTFQGNISSSVGTTAADINLGNGTNATVTMTVDTANNENLTIEGVIDAAGAGDTVTLAIANSDSGNANTVKFNSAIGGNEALDAVTIGANTTATFDETIAATKVTVSSANTTTFTKTITGALDIAADGTIALGANAKVSGAIDNTTGSDGAGTVTMTNATGGVNFGGAIGATNALKAFTAEANGQAVTFAGDFNAQTITLNDAGTYNLNGDTTGAVNVTGASTVNVAADKKIVGSLTTGTDGQGTLVFATATADTTLVSGAIGASGGNALLATTINTGAGVTSTLGGTVDSRTVTIAGTGTVAATDDITAVTKVDFTGDATLTVAANKKIVGNLDAGGNQGTATFAATTADTVLVSGTTGASNAIKAVNVAPATGVTATFTGAYDATTTTHSGAGTVAFGNTVAGAVNISGGGTVTSAGAITGTVDNTGTAGTGTLTLAAQQGVSGAIGGTAALAAVNSDSTGGTTAFGGAVTATTITAGGTGNTTFADDVTGTLALSANGTVTVAADKKIVGSVTNTGTTAEGTLTFGTSTTDTTLVSGNIGATGATLGTVNVDSGSGIRNTIVGNVFATTVNLDGTDGTGIADFQGNITGNVAIAADDAIFELGGTGAQTVSGAVTVATDNEGTINVTNTGGTVTFQGAVGVNAGNNIKAVTLAANTTSVFDSTLDAETLTVNGAATFDGAVNVGTDLVLGNGSTIQVGDSIANGASLITPAASATDLAGNTVNILMNGKLTDGQSVIVVDGGFANVSNATFTVSDTGLFDYTVVTDGSGAGDANDIEVQVSARTAAGVATNLGITSSDANALIRANADVQAGADTTGFAALNTALNTGGATAKTAAQQVGVQTDTLDAGVNALIATGQSFNNITSDRLSSLRGTSGVASGDGNLDRAAWVKTFGVIAEQEARGGHSGYDANTYGVAFGVDKEVREGVRIGASFAYANTDVDGDGAGNSQLDINSYQGSIYGDYTTDKYYVEGSIGYGMNNSDTSRIVNFGGLNRVVSGDYDTNQYMVSVAGGMPQKLSNGVVFTPTAGLAWTHLEGDTYTETGGTGFNLTVDQDDHDAFIASVGAKFHKDMDHNGGILTPELRLGLNYDLIGDEAAATGTYAGSTTSFLVEGADAQEFGGNIGLGLNFDNGQWSFGVNYDADIKSDYLGHEASLQSRFKF